MTPNVRPMLASPIELERVQYPVWVQPKLDGIRALVREGKFLSRTMKPIPNQFIQDCLAPFDSYLAGLDGELIVIDENENALPFNDIQSCVMSSAGCPNFRYQVFDVWWDQSSQYSHRFDEAKERVDAFNEAYGELHNWVEMVTPTEIAQNEEQLLEHHERIVNEGYEGSIVRFARGRYKYGRSTAKEGHLLKFKVWEDDEATVVGFVELQHNDNPQVLDAFGLAKRSSHKANQRAGDTLGTLKCEHARFGEFEIGSGFNFETRDKIWQNQADYLGKIVTFKYQPFGMKDKPRSPIFKGFRHPDDIGEPS
ncbi:MAG: hypothetical protein AB7L09_21370 [Nitrospira sp.]